MLSDSQHEEGYIVTLEGHRPTITEQLRLLPFSQNVLCLPPIGLPPAPPVRERADPEERLPPLDPAVRRFILALHDAHVDRLEMAKAFLAERRKGGGERMVFLNGGFAAAQATCLEILCDALMVEENGNLENASREAEWVFEDIMRGGVQGLQDQEEHGNGFPHEIMESDVDVEPVSDKHRMMTSFERAPFPKQLETPEPTPDNTPKMGEKERSSSPQNGTRGRSKPRVVSVLRDPTPEEIAAGVEICKASVAVRVRSKSNAIVSVPKYSPPPSPPTVKTEFHLGGCGTGEQIRKRSESVPDTRRPKGSRRKDRDDDYTLPPIESMHSVEIPTPPSSAKAIAEGANVSQFPTFSDESQPISAPEPRKSNSRALTRPSSPTPSSTADISGATILPSTRFLSCSFDVPPEFSKGPVDPLFPALGENLVIYFPSPETKHETRPQFLEKVLGDFAASFTPQTPGVFRANPQMLLIKRNNETQRRYLSPMTALSGQLGGACGRESFQSYMSGGSTTTTTTTNATQPWSLRSSLAGHHPDSPLSSIPTITPSAEKSPVDIQNELRAIMRQHFPPPPLPSVPNSKGRYSGEDEDEDEEDMQWLVGDDEIDQIWQPVLSSRGGDEGSAYSAIDLIVAVGVEEEGELTESRKGVELRKRLLEQIEEIARKKGSSWNRGSRVGLKYLLSSALPKMREQHPSTKNSLILKGQFLLPELEHYLSLNPQIRVLVIEFDFYTGSSAILELQRVLGPDVNVLKVACVADGVTQISAKPVKSSKSSKVGIRVRTSMGATTTTYTLGPGTPTTPTGSLRVPRKPTPASKRLHLPKQRLISQADVLIPPFTTISGAAFIDAVEVVHATLKAREKMTGHHGRNQDSDVPSTPVIVGPKTPDMDSQLSRQDTSYYLEEETDEEENCEGKRATFRKRVKNGSKALKWLGLE